jgi:hypothetical protein
MNDQMKAFCIDQMKRIVSARGEEPWLADVSKAEFEEALLKIAGVTVRSRGFVSGAVKSVLFNLDNFRPEVRSEFESGIFELWHEEFKGLHPEKFEPEVAEPDSVEIQPEPEPEPAPEAPQEPEPEPESEASQEPGPEPGPEESQELAPEPEPEVKRESLEKSDVTESSKVEKASSTDVLKRRRRDWFDLLLDASAAVTRPFARKQ